MNKREWMLQAGAAWLGGTRPANRNGLAGIVVDLSDMYDAIVAATPEPADEGWIEHRGEKPYPEGRVEIIQRNGGTDTGDADDFIWSHGYVDVPDEDIIAWRPARARPRTD